MKERVSIAIPDLEFQAAYKSSLLAAAADLGINLHIDLIGRDEKGGEETFLDPACFHAEYYDALLLPGGADVNPGRYGEEDAGSYPHPGLDELQFGVLEEFYKLERPILGICRGHQLINVFLNGSLYQDIEEKEQHKWLGEGMENIHPVTAEQGSVLYGLYGRDFCMNSSHHQAVKRLGEGLVITAKAFDGVVEAIEHTSLPIWGVQFHPERLCYEKKRNDAADGSLILKYFLRKAAEDVEA